MKTSQKVRKSGPQSKDLVKKILDEYDRFRSGDPKILQGKSEQEHLNSTCKENVSVKFKKDNYYSVGLFSDRNSISVSEAVNKIMQSFFSTQKNTIQQSPLADVESAIEKLNKSFLRLKNEHPENDVGDTNK